MNKILIVLAILLSGCATSEADKAYKAQCLPYTGCPISLETPEQFAARKLIEEQCLRHTGCPDEPGTPEEFQKRLVIEEKVRVEKLAQQELEKKQAVAKKEANDKLYRECSYEADKAMASRARPYDTFDIIYNTFIDEASKTSLTASCMKAKS